MDYSNNKVLTFEQGCDFLGFKKSYMYKMTHLGILPYSKPNGGRIFFERERLEAWMLGNATTSQQDKKIEAATYVTINQ